LGIIVVISFKLRSIHRKKQMAATQLQDLFDLQMAHFAELPGIVIILYDYLLCFKYEVHFVWRRKWNFGKVVYLLMRYNPTIQLPIGMAFSLWERKTPLSTAL
jgi:hypothetical protein